MPTTTLDIVQAGELPTDSKYFFQALTDPTGSFTLQEGETWDFKESWPSSYSDKYFSAICRLICAFANTAGGLIVFGVDDQTRTGGMNKVRPNLDKLQLALRQLTGRDADIDYKRFTSTISGAVDVILVKKKQPQQLPLRFQHDSHGYKAQIIWVRRGSEVREAEASDIPTLYCRASTVIDDQKSVGGLLPPSPATVRSFVGRMQTIDRVFGWLYTSDEPRTFLWGKGGSGKSTIAYEVARNLKYNGRGIVLDQEDHLEQVIFVSAKGLFLDIGSLKAGPFTGNDFKDEGGLYAAILTLGGAHEGVDLYQLGLAELRDRIREFFNQNSCFVVIDDIDTLTTAGKEAGIDYLYRVLSRSQKNSKLLYTLRNRPTHSISNSIEVPGLSDEDYSEFVEVCCSQFKVPKPSTEVKFGKLRTISESRPLVIESVIALRRNSGSYEGALQLFDQASGEDVRRYVFEREWQSLDIADRGREVLALLAAFGKPIGFSDLCIIAKLEEQKVRDALASVQEMFLVVDNNGEESTYDLGELTRRFVVTASKTLDYYELIKARVEKFKASFYPDSSELNRLIARYERASYVQRLGDNAAMHDLFLEMGAASLPPQLTEDPRFLALRGNTALFQVPIAFDRARHDFEAAFAFRYSPEIDYVRNWFDAERQSDLADSQTRKVFEHVQKAKGYSHAIRLEFASKRATFLYNFARHTLTYEPDTSVLRLFEALSLHLKTFRSRQLTASAGVMKTGEHARNTAFFLIQQLLRGDAGDRFINFVVDGVKTDQDWFLDPLFEPLGFLLQSNLRQFYSFKKDLQRAVGKMEQIKRLALKPKFWCDKSLADDLEAQIDNLIERATKALLTAN